MFGAVCCESAYSLMGKRLTADVSPLLITMAAAVVAGVAYALLGEAFHWAHVAGIALVLVGLVAVVRTGASVH